MEKFSESIAQVIKSDPLKVAEVMKATGAGPIEAILARREEILKMNPEEVEKLSKVLGSVAWCGGLGCGHGLV